MNATHNKRTFLSAIKGHGWGKGVLAVAIIAVGVGTASLWQPHTSFAEDPPTCNCDAYPGSTPELGQFCVYPDDHPERPGASYPCDAGTGPQAHANVGSRDPVVGCSIWDAETYGDCAFQLFYTIILAPAALILGVAGALLNFVIETTIVGFADFVKGTSDGAAGAISLAWGLIRDALNMTFIFILLYTGLRTILGVGNYQTVLPKIVFAGLLINFSFFFTSVLIDISNVATVELHNAIQDIGDAETVDANTGSLIEFSGISGAFMSGLQLRVQDGANPAQKFVMAIMSFVVMCVAAFVFFVMAAMLVVRYIILIILLITSPVAVMGGILPQLDSKKWWTPFTAQLTFPVLFMLFELIVILIINSTGFQQAIKGDYTDTSFFGQVAGALLGYALVLGLMVAGLIVAKQTAGAAGAGFTNWASKKA
ncbi:MAG TPA: hypothetical protein VJ837_03090, partial [Candidatus Paceibacterota bacterium]|nr:hypothetical protein [Candidatus Paceibacterota bacterium]